jgi:Omp85 superfamily domain
MKLSIQLLVLCIVINGHAIHAEDGIIRSYDSPPDSVIVVPGQQYQAGWFHRALFGSHWRDLWTMPIKVPVLDLATYAGGLIPVRKGGGMQTKSLRFRGADGREYKFRSINKDPSKVLPSILQRTLIADVLQDQISSANPLSALVVVPPLRAVGVLQAEPTVYLLPDTDAMGEFREEFGGILGMLEIHPDDYEEEDISFAGAENIVSTYKMFAKVDKNARHQPDAIEYLKARYMDLFLGDWDRHYDQWRWAAFKKNDTTYWRPIPRDRDQAFARFNGLFPALATLIVPQLNHFSDDYTSIDDLSWSGHFLDRRILPRLEWAQWDSLQQWVEAKLTDDVLLEGVQQLPEQHYNAEGESLFKDLKERRNDFAELTRDYYELLAEEVDIHATTDPDIVDVQRIDDELVEVSLYSREGKHDVMPANPYYSRKFHRDETDDIRIYLHDDDDQAIVRGDVSSSINIRIIGGKGSDTFVDSSYVHGYAFGLIPFVPSSEKLTNFYDSGKKSKFQKGASTSVVKVKFPIPKTDVEKYEPHRDWGNLHFHIPSMSYSSDLGLSVLYNHIQEGYSFRARPHQYYFNLGGDYAFFESKFRIDFHGRFLELIPGLHTDIRVILSSMEIVHYYGAGNESTFDQNLEEEDYYDISQTQYGFAGRFDLPLSEELLVGVGAGFRRVGSDEDDHRFVFVERPHGLDDYEILSVNTAVIYDSRDNSTHPVSGAFIDLQAQAFPKLFNVDEPFAKIKADLRGYITADIGKPVTLAMRALGQKVIFDTQYPFFESSYLGGKKTIRGFDVQRFAGDGALLGAAELRVELGIVKVVVPVIVGVSGFVESGQVQQRGVKSDLWHTGVGGGLWFSFVERMATLSVSIAQSKEDTGFYMSFGFPW